MSDERETPRDIVIALLSWVGIVCAWIAAALTVIPD